MGPIKPILEHYRRNIANNPIWGSADPFLPTILHKEKGNESVGIQQKQTAKESGELLDVLVRCMYLRLFCSEGLIIPMTNE